MERETFNFETPFSKQKVVMHSYITGREKRAIENASIRGLGTISAADSTMSGVNPEAIDVADDIAIRTIIVSLDDKRDGVDGFDIITAVLDMRSVDYNALKTKIKEVIAGKSFLVEGAA